MFDKDSPFALTPQAPPRGDSLGDLALATLRTAILACDPAPGSIVTEAELDSRFGLGLAATRAALARLSAIGWIDAKPRRGWRVLPVSGAHLADLLAARRLLEPILAETLVPPERAREMLIQADIYDASARQDGDARHFAELRAVAHCAGAVHQPSIRAWLTESWELSLRADRHLASRLSITRPALPLGALARALARGEHAQALALAGDMRDAFERRALAASGFSDAPIADAPVADARGPTRAGAPDAPTRRDGPKAAGDHPTRGQDR